MIGSDGWNGYDNGQQTSGSETDPMEKVGQDGENFTQLAFIFSVVAMGSACMMFPYLPYIFGPLAVVFAVISQGRRTRMQTAAKRSIMLAVLAIILNTVITGYSLYQVIYNPEMRQNVDSLMKSMYGTTVEESIGELKSLFNGEAYEEENSGSSDAVSEEEGSSSEDGNAVQEEDKELVSGSIACAAEECLLIFEPDAGGIPA